MIVLMTCYHSIAPCTCRGDISIIDICHLKMFILLGYIGRHNNLSLATLVVYLLALRFALLHRECSQ